MSDLFSHASSPEPTNDSVPPVVVRVTVAEAPEEAFLGWAEHIRLWWPVADFSVTGAEAIVDFESGELIEISEDDEVISWGPVTSWDPPSSFSIDWHPNRSALQATEVVVEFSSLPLEDGGSEGTAVTVSHSGWNNVPKPTAHRAEYAEGWPQVLERYVRFMGGPA